MIIHRDIIQGSEKWHELRRGRPTASRFSDIITAQKGELSKSAKVYTAELIADCFIDPALFARLPTMWEERGVEMEPMARTAFTELTGLKLDVVGFITRDDQVVGCSPDSLVLDEAGNPISGLELKCPMPKTHVQYVMEGTLPDDYKQQVHGSMAVTGLDSWHFFSFYPGLRPFHIVVERDEYTKKVEDALDQFIIDYQAARAKAIPLLKTSTKEAI